MTDENPILDKIETFLRAHGYDIGMFGNCPHSVGLPIAVFVKPVITVGRGDAECIAVTPLCVQRYSITAPFDHYEWAPLGQPSSYDSKDQLRETLDDRLAHEKGCWDE